MKRQWVLGLVGVCAVVGTAVGVRQLAARLSGLDGRIDALEATAVALSSRLEACERALASSSPVSPQSWVSPASRIRLEMPLNECIQLLGDPDEAFRAHDDEDVGYNWRFYRFEWKTYHSGVREDEFSAEVHHRLARMTEGSRVHYDYQGTRHEATRDTVPARLALRWQRVTVFFDDRRVARHIFVEPEATARP